MAKKIKPEKKLERVYNVPLRKEWLKSPKYRRAKKAVSGLKIFIAKHMKVDLPNVKIGPKLNEKLWERGIKSPPHHVKVTAIKETVEDKDFVKVELEGVEFKIITPKGKVEVASGLRGKLEKALGSRKEQKDEKVKKLEDLTDKDAEKKLEVKQEKDKVLTEEPKLAEKEAPKQHIEPKHGAGQAQKLEKSNL